MSNLFDLLTYQSYAHNRLESPEVSPERWARIFPNAAAMEKRFVREFEVALMQSTTGILDVAARNDGLSCSTVTYGATGGEATALASPLQEFTGERATNARRPSEASISVEKPELERRAHQEVSDFAASNSAHMLHASDGCLEGRPPLRATTSPVIQSLPVPLGREGATECGKLPLGANAADMSAIEPQGITSPLSNEHSVDSQILPEPFTLQQTGATASTSLSVVPENFNCFIERIDEFVAVRLPRIADCFCGRPLVHECPCGEPICANHSYDSLCGTCTEAKQLQQSSVMDGESRY